METFFSSIFPKLNEIERYLRYRRDLFLWEHTYLSFVLSYIWNIVPAFDIPKFIANPISQEILQYALLICFAVLGSVMLNSAANLRSSIRSFEDSERHRQWRRERGYIETPQNTFAVEINTLSKDQWHKRPLGILTLAVTGGVLVALIKMLLRI